MAESAPTVATNFDSASYAASQWPGPCSHSDMASLSWSHDCGGSPAAEGGRGTKLAVLL